MTYSPFTATGDGTTTAYTIAFAYIDSSDITAFVNDVETTAFTVSGSTVTFTTAPPSGQTIKISRVTENTTIQADFQSGSALRAVDLNSNFTQLLYVAQESTHLSNVAVADADTAVTTANTANATANTANTNSTNAVNTANTASTNATNAVNTANTASTNASNAVTTANAADANATTALNNSRESDGSGGYNTAIALANTASTNSSTALSTANTANATANAAALAVSEAAFYTPVGSLASLPASPADDDRVEVIDSTGVESNSAVSGVPSGFVGSTDLTIRLQYDSATSKWEWKQYFAADPENRYLKAPFLFTQQTITTSTVIAANTNAGLMGPTVALASGVTITVGSNSRLTVIS